MHDFATIPAWTLEEIVVERAAEELRVYMRSWRVNKTTPYTRADIATGDLATNSYRGFFGRRFSNSYRAAGRRTAVQHGRPARGRRRPPAQHHARGLVGRRSSGARTASSCVRDGAATNRSVNRRLSARSATSPASMRRNPTRTSAIGYGDSEGARWLQLIASTSRFAETNDENHDHDRAGRPPTTPFIGDTVDTIASRAQYVATGGVRFANTSLSGTARYRVFNGQWFLTPAARLSYDRGILAATVYAEQQESDSTFRGDASVRVKLLPFLAVSGSLGQTRPIKGNERPAIARVPRRGWAASWPAVGHRRDHVDRHHHRSGTACLRHAVHGRERCRAG